MVREGFVSGSGVRVLACLLLVSGAGAAVAQEVRHHPIEMPEPGVRRTATAGDEIWSYQDASSTLVHGIRTSGPVKAHSWTAGGVELPAGSMLAEAPSERGLKACLASGGATILGNKPCLIDADLDGAFESFAYNKSSKPGALPSPVPYAKGEFEADRFVAPLRRVVVYTGGAAGELKLTYREYSAGIARPAFTEELTIPLETSYPQTVSFKGVTMLIEKRDGRGLVYSIERAGGVSEAK